MGTRWRVWPRTSKFLVTPFIIIIIIIYFVETFCTTVVTFCNCGSWWHWTQNSADSFCTRYDEVTPSLLSEVHPPNYKAVDIQKTAPIPRLVTGRWSGNTSDYPHSLAGRSVPCLRVVCRPWTSIVLHSNSPKKTGLTASLQKYYHWQYTHTPTLRNTGIKLKSFFSHTIHLWNSLLSMFKFDYLTTTENLFCLLDSTRVIHYTFLASHFILRWIGVTLLNQ